MNLNHDLCNKLGYLRDRWQEESEYEDWNDYVTQFRNICLILNVTFISAQKKPFGFNYRDRDGRQFRVTVSCTSVYLKESPMVTSKSNPTLTKKTSPRSPAADAALEKAKAPKAPAKAKAPAKPTPAAKPAFPQDGSIPAFLDRSKTRTPEQNAADKAAADRDDRQDSTIEMPAAKPPQPKKTELPAGALSPKQIAAELGTDDRKLRRTLRAMAKAGKLKHDANGRWAITKADISAIKAFIAKPATK